MRALLYRIVACHLEANPLCRFNSSDKDRRHGTGDELRTTICGRTSGGPFRRVA
jgi:hypothetical protein